MNEMPVTTIAVGVIVERVTAASPWIDFTWRPTAVLVGQPETSPWRVLSDHGEPSDPDSRRIVADIQSIYDRLPPDGRLRLVIRGAMCGEPFAMLPQHQLDVTARLGGRQPGQEAQPRLVPLIPHGRQDTGWLAFAWASRASPGNRAVRGCPVSRQ